MQLECDYAENILVFKVDQLFWQHLTSFLRRFTKDFLEIFSPSGVPKVLASILGVISFKSIASEAYISGLRNYATLPGTWVALAATEGISDCSAVSAVVDAPITVSEGISSTSSLDSESLIFSSNLATVSGTGFVLFLVIILLYSLIQY